MIKIIILKFRSHPFSLFFAEILTFRVSYFFIKDFRQTFQKSSNFLIAVVVFKKINGTLLLFSQTFQRSRVLFEDQYQPQALFIDCPFFTFLVSFSRDQEKISSS